MQPTTARILNFGALSVLATLKKVNFQVMGSQTHACLARRTGNVDIVRGPDDPRFAALTLEEVRVGLTLDQVRRFVGNIAKTRAPP